MEYILDNNAIMDFISTIVNAPIQKGILSHRGQQDREIREAWIEYAVTINIDRLYESME